MVGFWDSGAPYNHGYSFVCITHTQGPSVYSFFHIFNVSLTSEFYELLVQREPEVFWATMSPWTLTSQIPGSWETSPGLQVFLFGGELGLITQSR